MKDLIFSLRMKRGGGLWIVEMRSCTRKVNSRPTNLVVENKIVMKFAVIVSDCFSSEILVDLISTTNICKR